MIYEQNELLKKTQKDFEPIMLSLLRNKGIIQKGETIEFEWREL